ncbi:hypothetical protein CC86DRAFT_413496 [Ophiobolus disseminans]|uniref:Uncharacterized protein n=1 Tax=Ophiobolus disseminans TaxID=1469910 RepID=A0A6A6ZEU8_9PLEO|nr:hypothetical protein CC86DRAFT_413496 [Ophiobolus disseminans]
MRRIWETSWALSSSGLMQSLSTTQRAAMNLEECQIVGFDKVPCITSWHGVWRSPGAIWERQKKQRGAEFRNTILEAYVVKASPCTALAQPGLRLRVRSLRMHGALAAVAATRGVRVLSTPRALSPIPPPARYLCSSAAPARRQTTKHDAQPAPDALMSPAAERPQTHDRGVPSPRYLSRGGGDRSRDSRPCRGCTRTFQLPFPPGMPQQ